MGAAGVDKQAVADAVVAERRKLEELVDSLMSS